MATSRRRFLQASAASGLGALCARCGGAPAAPSGTRVPLAELGDGARRTLSLGGRPVEVRLAGGEAVARSLLCTHMGCTVRWDEAAGLYVCPCHEGRFDEQGRNVAGPPARPLDRVAVRIEGPDIIVG